MKNAEPALDRTRQYYNIHAVFKNSDGFVRLNQSQIIEIT